MSGNVSMRAYQPADTVRLVDIFVQAVLSIDENIYSHQQKLAWSAVGEYGSSFDKNHDKNHDKWRQRFAKTQPLLAIDNHDMAIGFIEFLPNINHLGEQVKGQGYIDCLYVHPDYQRQGVAQQLYQQGVVKPAKSLAIDKIWVHASLVAKPFFCQQGFEAVQQQMAHRGEVELSRWLMCLS